MSSSIETRLLDQLESPEFRSLFKTRPAIHAWDTAWNWALIIATIYLATNVLGWWFYPVAVLIIGARMHALAILMHDAAHFRFLKSKKWNDLLTNLLVMYPIFSSLDKYRDNHLRHHTHLNTDHDPDWVAKLGKRAFTFPQSRTEFLGMVASYFFLYQGAMDALWFLKRFKHSGTSQRTNADSKPLRFGYYFLLFGSITWFGLWPEYLLYWIVPYFSTFFMFQYIRSVAEHFGELAYEDALSSSRTTKANWVERFFIAPHNVGLHLEHHLYPAVPYYHLPALHRMLMQEPDFLRGAHITQGYLRGLLQELKQGGVPQGARVATAPELRSQARQQSA